MIPFLSRPTISSTILWAEIKLKQLTDTPRLEAEILLAFVLKKPKEFLYKNPRLSLSKNSISQFKRLITNRQKSIPVAYLTKNCEFYAIPFIVTKDTLIPRPETEKLVEVAIAEIKKLKLLAPKILEIGTGSGCISISLKKELPSSKITASDFSKKALTVARKNAKNLAQKVDFVFDDIFKTNLSGHKFEVILSNPPYIPEPEYAKLQLEVKQEPKAALIGGKDGLSFYREFAKIFPQMLSDKGFALLELHSSNAKSTQALFKAKFNTKIIKDDTGRDRILMLTKKDSR